MGRSHQISHQNHHIGNVVKPKLEMENKKIENENTINLNNNKVSSAVFIIFNAVCKLHVLCNITRLAL